MRILNEHLLSEGIPGLLAAEIIMITRLWKNGRLKHAKRVFTQREFVILMHGVAGTYMPKVMSALSKFNINRKNAILQSRIKALTVKDTPANSISYTDVVAGVIVLANMARHRL